MRETRDGVRVDMFSSSASADSDLLVLDIDDFKVTPQMSYNVYGRLCQLKL